MRELQRFCFRPIVQKQRKALDFCIRRSEGEANGCNAEAFVHTFHGPDS
jgi:hypothetical protein